MVHQVLWYIRPLTKHFQLLEIFLLQKRAHIYIWISNLLLKCISHVRILQMVLLVTFVFIHFKH